MPNINIKEMEGLHEDPLQHDKNEIFYFNNFHEDFVYKNCKIDDFSFSYLTDSFINNQLQSIIFKINKNSIIEFECYSDEEESSKIKFRYFGTK